MDCEPEIIFDDDDKSEGEISSDSDDIEKTYIPLERPSHVHAEKIIASKVTEATPVISDKSDENTSDSSSDSDNHCTGKKPRLKIKPRRPTQPKVHNRYKVWSEKAQEDLLTETMISCDVTKTDRSRDVETYDYPKRREDLKRKFSERGNVHLRLGKRFEETREKKGTARFLIDLTVTALSTDDEVAAEIASKLSEAKDELLKRLVQLAGKQRAIDIYEETRKIEEDGGMLVLNQTRRRTPGGVYFFLIKHDTVLTEEEKRLIFQDDKKVINKARQRKRRKVKREEKMANLISQAELKLSKENNRVRKDSDHTEHVSNPPPSPVTDGKENSSDETTDNPEEIKNVPKTDRDVAAYDDDYLEINCETEMDFFS